MSNSFKIARLAELFDALSAENYSIIAPVKKNDAILYDEVSSVDDLPKGWTVKQNAGKYHLQKRDDEALFGYNLAANSWKRFLHPPEVKLFSASKTSDGFEVVESEPEAPKQAFIGVRSCELKAIEIQDKVLLENDEIYRKNRENSLIIAVNCVSAQPTCFCTSMNGSPEAKSGYDLSVTEIINEAEHYFLIRSGSDKGLEILSQIKCTEASAEENEVAKSEIANAARQMQKYDMSDAAELLLNNLDSAYWDKIAEKCLACGNCTMACPTCFCTTIEDVTDLTGDNTERWRKWDSCFSLDFSYIHGGNVRKSAKSRYRQWITHKLSSWHEQFGESGCTGCGSCVTWCPVEIDIRDSLQKIREAEND